MTKGLGWELYRSFLSVLEEGSLSAAARVLGITQPTIGRHISAMEDALGLMLFTRSQAGLIPTESALALRPYAEAMRSTSEALRRAATNQGEGVKGAVRITASEIIGVEVLPPIVAGLRQAHPGLTIELAITNQMQDLLQREADIAVRMAAPLQKQLIARRAGDIPVGLFAHRDYLARYGEPQTIEQLHRHTLIGFDRETPFLRDVRRIMPLWSREAFSIRTDSDIGGLALIRAGCGIGACQVALGKRDPDLVCVLSTAIDLKLEAWVTMHEDLRNNPCCRVTFDVLVKELTAYAAEAAA